jgi:hypothetical protein
MKQPPVREYNSTVGRIGDQLLPSLGGAGFSSFALFIYQVPKDLPRGVLIHCSFHVHLESERLANDYGNAILSVRKWSDL